MATFQERFHEAMVRAFEERAQGYNEQTDLYSLGDASAVDDFFDYLEFEFSGDVTEEQRHHIRYVGQAWTLAWAAYEIEQEEEAAEETEASEEEDFSNANDFLWKDKILPIQRLLLKVFYVGGLATFGYGMYLTTKAGNPKTGGLLSGLGMFIAVQMFWGMQSFFVFLQKRNSKLLRSPGYPTLFWIAVTIALVFDFLVMGFAQEYAMDLLVKFKK